MDYNSPMLGKIYRMTDDGGKEQINLNGIGYTVTPVNLAANTQGIAKMAFFDDLQPGNYVVEVLIYKDFQGDINNASLSSFFPIATMQLTMTPATAIRDIEQAAQTSTAPSVYDLSGRKVQNPQKGIYIKKGKKTIF